MNVPDLTGQKFTKLTVIGRAANNKKGNAMWLCRCDCGKERIVKGSYLRSGNTKSCGCYKAEKIGEERFKDISGEKFGRLTVIKRAENKGNRVMWLCKCDCGKETIVSGANLRSGTTKSCGCIHTEMMRNMFCTHGASDARLYLVWANMKRRCCDKKDKEYKRYGGRGIKVCDDWQEYSEFERWALSSGYDETAKRGDCTLDRINNDGDYCPWNCRWADVKTQSNNRRSNRILEFNGESHTIAQWAEIVGIKPSTLERRVQALGWSAEKALTTPKCKNQHG